MKNDFSTNVIGKSNTVNQLLNYIKLDEFKKLNTGRSGGSFDIALYHKPNKHSYDFNFLVKFQQKYPLKQGDMAGFNVKSLIMVVGDISEIPGTIPIKSSQGGRQFIISRKELSYLFIDSLGMERNKPITLNFNVELISDENNVRIFKLVLIN